MSEPIKKTKTNNPESYKPETPKLMNMLQELCTENIIEIITIEGVDFTIIEKAKTLYAGNYAVAQDLQSEPNFNEHGTFKPNDDGQVLRSIKDSVTPDRMLVLSIDYDGSIMPHRPCAMLRGQETTSYNQPDGIHIIEAEPTILIKVKYSDEAWALTKKLTGEDNPQWHMAPLFGLIKHIFWKSGQYNYEFNGCKQNGNEEIEHYCFNGDKYVTVPMIRRSV